MTDDEVLYFTNHVFLPPRLPLSDDFTPENDRALMQCVYDALVEFKSYIPAHESVIQSLAEMMRVMLATHTNVADTVVVDEDALERALRNLQHAGGCIALHIRDQNAGLLISKKEKKLHFEAFELTPVNVSVISTMGRLRRCFPGSATAVSISDSLQPGFVDTLAVTLSRMSIPKAPDTQMTPKKEKQPRKASKKAPEKAGGEFRDTTDPKVVTELLVAYLLAMGSPLEEERIWKNTREEVHSDNSSGSLPWRRSSTWLLIRVALQLVLGRHSQQLGLPGDLYKDFMVFLMATFLDHCLDVDLPSEPLLLMNAKLSRRLRKLECNLKAPFLARAQKIMRRSNEVLTARWVDIQHRDTPPLRLSRLTALDLEEDTITHIPALDEFIKSLSGGGKRNTVSRFTPSFIPTPHEATQIPDLNGISDKSGLVFTLAAFEDWVERHLEGWLKSRLDDQSTQACCELRQVMQSYYAAAMPFYTNNPEMTSIMTLTVIELWIACDKMAAAIYPMLLNYDPGLPQATLQGLVLSRRKDMERLHRAETHLACRSKGSSFPPPKIYSDFGSSDSFPVRYFDQSETHQLLRQSIEKKAQRDRDAKLREFGHRKRQYRRLINKAGRRDCDYDTVDKNAPGGPRKVHSENCKKHRQANKAREMTIGFHEWPLPMADLEAKAVVFELSVPPSFGHWREATVFVLFDVFKVRHVEAENSQGLLNLQHYEGLASYFSKNIENQQVYLSSQTQPYIVSYQHSFRVATATISEVCYNNGMNYKYYHETTDQIFNEFISSEIVTLSCIYSLPKSMRKYLLRTASGPNSRPPNEAIAKQSVCPDNMTIEEFKSLCTIPLGYSIQWQNVLVQLFSPTVDFKKTETQLVILQCIYQAGPPNDSVARAAHSICEDEYFSGRVLEGLRDATLRFQENWHSSVALSTFIYIARRLLSLTGSADVRKECLSFLDTARSCTFSWVETLKAKAQGSDDGQEKISLQKRVLEVALICCDTFSVEENLRREILSKDEIASVFIQCGISIQETSQAHLRTVDGSTRLTYRRWQRNCFYSSEFLIERIVSGQSTALDNAIRASWSGYESGDAWRLYGRHNAWLTSGGGSSRGSLSLHFCLATGELLVNGLPLGLLPKSYSQNATYETLFGSLSLEIMPTSVSRMQFSSKRQHAGHVIHLGLGLRSANSDLLVQAVQDDRRYEFVPKQFLQGNFPRAFVEDYVHWYGYETGSIEFCPISTPWTHSTSGWRLRKTADDTGWMLTQGRSNLVNIRTQTFRTVSAILLPLEDPAHVHIAYHPKTLTLSMELPRQGIEFTLQKGQTSIMSRQFRGMSIDQEQSIGTLVGLRDKLVLKVDKPLHHLLSPDRKVLIPEGPVSCRKNKDHVMVEISKSGTLRVQAYDVDAKLGRLVSNGGRQGMLFLSYLHALTSFGLPDPLTRRTGTESSLSILGSASILSFDHLTKQNVRILELLAKLTPGRACGATAERSMQKTSWSDNLGCLAQHGFFLSRVDALFSLARRSKFLSPEISVVLPEFDHVDPGLLTRDNIRSATFRGSGFGAECHIVDQDVVYCARDCTVSDRGSNAFSMADLVFSGRDSLVKPPVVDLQSHLWRFLATDSPVMGADGLLDLNDIMYSTELLGLGGSSEFVRSKWIVLQHKLRSKINKFRMMIWLATLAFAPASDMAVMQTLALFYTRTDLSEIVPLEAYSFSPSKGYVFESDSIRSIITSNLIAMSQTPEGEARCERKWRDWRSRRSRREWMEKRDAFGQRQLQSFRTNRDSSRDDVVSALRLEWPRRIPEKPAVQSPEKPDWNRYIKWEGAAKGITELFTIWFDNLQLWECLVKTAGLIGTTVTPAAVPTPKLVTPVWMPGRKPGFLECHDVFKCSVHLENDDKDWVLSSSGVQTANTSHIGRVSALIQRLNEKANAPYQKHYVESLESSLEALKALHSTKGQPTRTLTPPFDNIERSVMIYHLTCKQRVHDIYSIMVEAILLSNVIESRSHAVLPDFYQRPRLSPVFFLERLNKDHQSATPEPWKECITEYGIAITHLQRSERMLKCLEDPTMLNGELCNPGHTNWDPREFPDTLLLEVESGIMVREVQEDIARCMRSPPSGNNAVMQLNMGEGKSSVIAPAVAAALADGSRLARIIVAKPQSKQMQQMLDSKLGGLINRRVYHMPFSRAVKLEPDDSNAILTICRECMQTGGVMLVQPEQMLSFQLMGIETGITNNYSVKQSLLSTKDFLDENSRDIVDESDENFSIKFELVYTIGKQRATDHSPTRWLCIQHVLDVLRKALPAVEENDSSSIEVVRRHDGCFPRTRILRESAKEAILSHVARQLAETGSAGLPIASQPGDVREAVFTYICKPNLSQAEIDAVEKTSLWSTSTMGTILLLRGLFACQLLAFLFAQKRWRVDFGLDHTRTPGTRLAVPYRAKDNPTARSEFSHPDVIIVLTSLSYYYGGLSDEDLFLTFEKLAQSDQADVEYRSWVEDSDCLPRGFHQLSGVNLEDRLLCAQQVFPCLRYAKSAIDYFLASIVFPKELREFPHKLSASGWDIGEKKTHPTTGFSGTCDSRVFLPLSVAQLDLSDQKHTNALVMEYLLREENSVELMPRKSAAMSDAEVLLGMVVRMQPPARVILDVGAQILELDSLQVAKRWLDMVEESEHTQAVIFCDENDQICVVDRRGRVEAFHTSPFVSQTDVCLVFLDEAHTRGTDLKLPDRYRAAVTLGANLTKDRLVQACMRMRKLGKGQSVVFYVPDEIRQKIKSGSDVSDSVIDVADILEWSISETWIDLQRGIHLWANQGRRHNRHAMLWKKANWNGSIWLNTRLANQFLEDEGQNLEKRYRPNHRETERFDMPGSATGKDADPITRRLLEFAGPNPDSATYQEEQERELAPETEQETQVQKPTDATPNSHSVHLDVRLFVASGIIKSSSSGYMPAFQALSDTSAAKHFDTTRFGHGLLATRDFATTIKPRGKSCVSDSYQRPVQWILASSSKGIVSTAMVISPHEAQELLPAVKESGIVSLHLYAPRPNVGFRPLDSLDLYTVPDPSVARVFPRKLVLELNLFSGQMYVSSFAEYLEVRWFFGFDRETDARSDSGACITSPEGVDAPDGGLIQFMRVLMMQVRRDCKSIDKTHIGRILDERAMLPSDFE